MLNWEVLTILVKSFTIESIFSVNEASGLYAERYSDLINKLIQYFDSLASFEAILILAVKSFLRMLLEPHLYLLL